MGSENEKLRIQNEHAEEVDKIIMMKEDNDRKNAIEEMKVKYNFQLKNYIF